MIHYWESLSRQKTLHGLLNLRKRNEWEKSLVKWCLGKNGGNDSVKLRLFQAEQTSLCPPILRSFLHRNCSNKGWDRENDDSNDVQDWAAVLLSFFLHAQVKLPILRSIHTNQNAEMKLFFDLLHHSVWNSTSDVLRYRTECEQGFFRTHYTASNLDKQIRIPQRMNASSPWSENQVSHISRLKCLEK